MISRSGGRRQIDPEFNLNDPQANLLEIPAWRGGFGENPAA
jgi:hypothetical protein